MPSYISRNGIWTPANEKAVNIETGEIYEGPDREASKFIKEETGSKTGTIGMDVTKDPENIMRARQLGMSVDEFLGLNKPPTPEQVEAEKAKEDTVVTHIQPTPKRGRPKSNIGSGGFGEVNL